MSKMYLRVSEEYHVTFFLINKNINDNINLLILIFSFIFSFYFISFY